MYKILSLDGGGSWAVIQLLTLKEIYPNKTGHEVLREFDLVIANSGGSIALAALASNWTLDHAISMFDDKEFRTKVFAKIPFSKRYFPTGITRLFSIGPKYSTTKKYHALREIFKEIEKIPLCKLPAFIKKDSLKLVVCTFDALENKAKFFRSYRGTTTIYDDVTLIKAVHGSSNAPVNYFDFPANFKAKESEKFYYLWDGALGGFNNPVAAGIIEAIKGGQDKKDISILSLGTSSKLMPEGEKKYYYKLYINVLKHRKTRPAMGFKFFMKSVLNLAKTILYEPPDWANYIAYILRFDTTESVLEKTKFVRLSPLIYSQIDDLKKIQDLVAILYKMDMDILDGESYTLIKECFSAWRSGILRNQGIESYVDAEGHLIYVLGHKTFQEALSDWLTN